MSVKIITDSMSDIPLETAQSYDIDVLPIEISLNGTFILDNDLNVEDTAEWIEGNKKMPEFKGVSTALYTETFEKYVTQGMEIVCITAGSKSISNYDCACLASTRFPEANIHVIDSHMVAGSTGVMAVTAAIMARDGESANAIAIRFERSMDRFKQYGLADSVTYLQYAGLCPRIVAVGSNLLNAKYEFEMLKDKGFDVSMAGNSMTRAITSYTNNVFRDLRHIDSSVVFLLYTLSDENYFTEVYRRVEELNYFDEIIVAKAGNYSTSLVGRSGMSIAYKLK